MKKENIIYGRHPVVDAIKSGQAIDKLAFQKGIRGPFEKEIRKLSKQYGIPVSVIPKERLNKITNKNHQGIIAYLSLIEYYDIEQLLPLLYEKPQPPLILILDGVTDVRNFGAIARTAECAGVGGIVIPLKGAAQINAEAMKTSAGALNIIPVCRANSISKVLDFLQLSGIQIVASDLRGTKKLGKLDLKIPTAIIIGSEDKGVNPHFLQKADETFIIPQVGQTDSYNVSVATGMMLYECLRQRY